MVQLKETDNACRVYKAKKLRKIHYFCAKPLFVSYLHLLLRNYNIREKTLKMFKGRGEQLKRECGVKATLLCSHSGLSHIKRPAPICMSVWSVKQPQGDRELWWLLQPRRLRRKLSEPFLLLSTKITSRLHHSSHNPPYVSPHDSCEGKGWICLLYCIPKFVHKPM